MAGTSYKQPFRRASTISRNDANYRVTNGNIAAIDFGTTSVSIAYTTKGDEKVNTLILDIDNQDTRVPNAVLLKRDGGGISVAAFGGIARKKFSSMRSGQHSDFIYFERIKMLMKRDEANPINRQSLVESFSGEKFYLVEVIAFILKYLKELIVDILSRTVKQLKTTDFDWVITVPAIWDARGKRMMREAAYLAGLLTESGAITKFTPVSGRALSPPNEINPDKLSLALEPESAAIYSQEEVIREIEGAGRKAAISRPTDYLVIDIGGGTVDITAHSEVDGGIKIENLPTGNACGGTRINEAFSEMLQELVDDPKFEKYLGSGDRSSNMAALNKILYKDFEDQKVLFGQRNIEKEVTVGLAGKFTKFYEKTLQNVHKNMSGVEFDDDNLYITQEVMETKLFGPTIDGIIDCTLKAIKDNDYKADTFYLVGGFGGCKYVHEKVKFAIERLYRSKGLADCHVIVPPTPYLAVATGAAMWRKDPEKIKARRVDATYGIGIALDFDPKVHDEHYRFFNEDQKKYKCGDIFNVFLEKGELASADKVITSTMLPFASSSTTLQVNIHRTDQCGVQYITDKSGKPTVMKIGQLMIDIPNPDNLPREERRVDITMDFSGTEIQAKAKYRVNGKEVKTVCDFLSADD